MNLESANILVTGGTDGYGRGIPDETLRKAVEEQGFSVVSVSASLES